MAERLAFSVEETAETLGVSRDVLYDELRAGKLGSIKVGRRRLITRNQLEAYLASLETAA
jgi:excisionase family DNA binding protein